MKDLTIGIVSYNNKELVRKCISSIYDSQPEISYEIILVDNNSADGTVQDIKKEFSEVKIIENATNLGFAAANNRAISESKSRYFLMLNPDTVVLKDSLDNLVRFMDSHPEAGAAGPKLLNEDGTTQHSCKKFLDLKTAFFIDTLAGLLFPNFEKRYRMNDFNYGKTAEVDQPMGACLLVRRETINKVGLLDERFFFFFEEVDWCYRIKKSGWKIFFVHNSEVFHYKGQGYKDENVSERIFLWHKGKYKFIEKHYGKFASGVLRGFVILSSLLFLVKNLLLGKSNQALRALIRASV